MLLQLRMETRATHTINPEQMKAASRVASKTSYKRNPNLKRNWNRQRYSEQRVAICAKSRAGYSMKEPKSDVREIYVESIAGKSISMCDVQIALI